MLLVALSAQRVLCGGESTACANRLGPAATGASIQKSQYESGCSFAGVQCRLGTRAAVSSLACSLRLCMALVLAAPCVVDAQEVAFREYGLAEGLPSLAVMDLAEDADGMLWVATEHGLARYDGFRFRFFRAHAGAKCALGGDLVHAIAPHPEGGLWIWTGFAGLQYFDPHTEAFGAPLDLPGLAPSSVYVFDLHAGADGSLWFGTDRGVFVRHGGRVEQVAAVPSEASVLALAPGLDEDVWIGTDSGLYRAALLRGEAPEGLPRAASAGEDGGAEASPFVVRRVALPEEAWRVNAVLEGENGDVYLGTPSGLFVREQQEGAWRRMENAAVRSLALAPDGGLWVGTELGLVHREPNGQRRVYTPETDGAELPGLVVRWLHVSRSGTLWAGLSGHGIASRPAWVSPVRRYAGYIGEAISAPLAIMPTREEVWVGGIRGGLCRLAAFESDAPGCAETPRGDLVYGRVSSLAEGPDGTVWVAAWEDRVYCMRPGARSLRPCGDAPEALTAARTVLPTSSGHLWVASADAGVFVRDSAGAWAHLPTSSRIEATDSVYTFPMALLEDALGRVWVGTVGGGLYRIESEAGSWRVERIPLRPEGDAWPLRVVSLARSLDGGIYAATLGDGVFRIDEADDTVLSFGPEAGLPALVVHSVEVDAGGAVWAFTDAGASRLEEDGQFVTFGAAEGFPVSSLFWNASALGPDGTMYVGTMNGLIVFDPRDLLRSVPLPEPHVVKVRVEGSEVPRRRWDAQVLALGPRAGTVSVELAASEVNPDRTWRFAYRLTEGAERLDRAEGGAAVGSDEAGAWVPLGRAASLDLAGLGAGTYALDVRTQTAGQVGPVRSLWFSIAPFFWETWWFRVLILFAFAMGVAAIYRAREERIRAVEQTRIRIADDLHDDLGSKIATLALHLEFAERSPEAASALGSFAHRAHALNRDLRDLIWIVHGEADTLRELAARIEDVATEMLGGERCVVDLPQSLPEITVPMEARRHVLLATREVLHNALRHSQATCVTVRVETTGGMFTVEIADDGVGFDQAAQSLGRGMTTVRRRAESLGGTADVESALGEGTTTTLRIPLSHLTQFGGRTRGDVSRPQGGA